MPLIDMQRNIKHVVHLMLENRGFDTLLGWLYADGAKPPKNVPGLRSGELSFYGVQSGGETWQPDDPSFFGSGPYLGRQWPINRGNWGYCHMPVSDPGEPWDQVFEQIYGPNKDLNLPPNKLMRGFWLNYSKQWGVGSNQDILATSTPQDLPVINTLARAFAVSDMWFSSAPTETNPNRAFSLGGNSPPNRTVNESFNGNPYKDLRTIFTVFNEQGVSCMLYADHYWKPR